MSDTRAPDIVPSAYAGKWIAWSKDAARIVAAGDTPDEARAAAERAGVHEIVYQWVPPTDELLIGRQM